MTVGGAALAPGAGSAPPLSTAMRQRHGMIASSAGSVLTAHALSPSRASSRLRSGRRFAVLPDGLPMPSQHHVSIASRNRSGAGAPRVQVAEQEPGLVQLHDQRRHHPRHDDRRRLAAELAAGHAPRRDAVQQPAMPLDHLLEVEPSHLGELRQLGLHQPAHADHVGAATSRPTCDAPRLTSSSAAEPAWVARHRLGRLQQGDDLVLRPPRGRGRPWRRNRGRRSPWRRRPAPPPLPAWCARKPRSPNTASAASTQFLGAGLGPALEAGGSGDSSGQGSLR